jgi:hypothetical protein
MFRLLLSVVGFLTLVVLAACAGLGEPAVPEYGARTKPIGIGYIAFADVGPPGEPGSSTSAIFWDLTVAPYPTPIVSGEPFAADIQATATISESLIANGQLIFEGGFKDVMLVDFQATVTVRAGAIGEPVVLTPDAIPYVCEVSRTACNPDNDLPGTERVQGNTDCEGLSASNPCGRLVEIPWSDDCNPGGLCDDLGLTGEESQCAANGFCVTGPVTIALTGPLGAYEAEASGSILFGFDDGEKTGFEILGEEGGCNEGTYYSELPAFEDDLGSNGMRVRVGGIPLTLEFIMGEECRGPYGIDCCDPAASPTPDYRLIRFPIQPAP